MGQAGASPSFPPRSETTGSEHREDAERTTAAEGMQSCEWVFNASNRDE